MTTKPRMGQCDCGRSPIDICNGWHSFTEEEYQLRLKEYNQKRKKELENNQKKISSEEKC